MSEKLPDFAHVVWRKSMRSAIGNCVEVAATDGWIGVRDSKDPQGGKLQFPARSWSTFLLGMKSGEFDGPVRG